MAEGLSADHGEIEADFKAGSTSQLNMFDIYLTDELVPEDEEDGVKKDTGTKAAYGKIHIGDYSETFVAILHYWTPAQYAWQWETALRRIIEGRDRSALITSYVEAAPERFLFWWVLYRENDIVYIQNQMLFFDQLDKAFSVEHPWESVGARETITEEGREISEWTTSIEDVRECLERKTKDGSGLTGYIH